MAHRIPIHQDDLSFEERQSKVWEDMEKDMERRRQEWEDEIERMRSDFFQLKPNSNGKLADTLSDKLSVKDSMDDTKTVIEKDQNGRPVFRARFNVHEYKPEEVNVKMESNKIIVYAKHEEKDGHKSVSREFSREVNIPNEVDPMALQCTISKDGILTVEAPMPVPGYQQITEPGMSTHRIIPTATPIISNTPPRNIQPTVTGQPPTTHTSTFTTFMSPKGSTSSPAPPPPSFSPGSGSMPQSAASTTHRSFSPQSTSSSHVTSSTTRYDTRSGSGSPLSMDREKKYHVEIDIEDFSPEDLNIKTVDKKLVITARREERMGSRTSTKELNREFSLPDTVDPMAVKAFFSDSGKLLVEAPYQRSINVSHFTEGRESSPHFGTSSPLSGSLIR